MRDKTRFSAIPAWTKGSLAATLALLALATLAPAAAQAEETHIFDATLSLTGSCATNTLDPVPDPGTCPGVAGVDHPAKRFKVPRNIATDEYGDIYVANKSGSGEDSAAVIDVFSPTGHFITEVPDHRGVERVAVDSEGNLYAHRAFTVVSPLETEEAIVLYHPKVYKPQSGEIEYETTPTYVVAIPSTANAKGFDHAININPSAGIAVDRSDDHLFLNLGASVAEFGSATEGNPLLDDRIGAETRERYGESIRTYDSEGNLIGNTGGEEVDKGPAKNRFQYEFTYNGEGKVIEEIQITQETGPVLREAALLQSGGRSIAIDAANHDIYVDSGKELSDPDRVLVLDGGDPNHPLLRTIDGSCLPDGHFNSNTFTAGVSIAIDESNGHVFVDDRASSDFAKRFVYEFTETGECVSTIEHGFENASTSEIAIDNGAHSPNGALDPNGRYLYVPSGEIGTKSHVYAFGPVEKSHEAPEVESAQATSIGEAEAVLRAKINPKGVATHYAFELTTQASYEDEGFAGAEVTGEGGIPVDNLGVDVFAPASGLSPGTAYRFRVLAESLCKPAGCTGEGEATFTTFAPVIQAGSCENQALRVGPSAALPDCRAYELVTPPDTGGRPLHDPEAGSAGNFFGTPPASPDGESLAFLTLGGALPNTEAAGSFSGSPYAATRGVGGWHTESVGMSGTQAAVPLSGGMSADHAYTISNATEAGSLVLDTGTLNGASYLRHPDGSFHLLGQGSLATDPVANAMFIAPGGTHVIFASGAGTSGAIPLELESPLAGTAALYDRTPDEVTHVISLLPGNVAPAAGNPAQFEGASADGNAVAFKVPRTGPLYVRLDDEKTVELAGSGATFEGLSADGRYAFDLHGGDLYRYDTESEEATRITESGDATVVNVAASGAGAYFVSPSVLTGSEQKPNGAEAQPGGENLYLWDGSATRFVGTVTERDVEGEFTGGGGFHIDGLGLWASALETGEMGADPSRSTPDGAALLFESRAKLTGYDPEGHAEVYRFDVGANSLSCLSCSPARVAAVSDASLQATSKGFGEQQPTSRFALIPNLSPNGARAFFQTSDALVPADTDGVQDVYEWEAEGEGTCATPGGCTFLVSSGQSARDNYLFGVSESGKDVFISTSDLLVAADGDETPSIYDARVEGGFSESAGSAAECLGEACQPAAVAPEDQTPGSASFQGAGNVKEETPAAGRCPKGKRLVRKAGRSRCVAKHSKKPHKRHHKRASSKRRAGR